MKLKPFIVIFIAAVCSACTTSQSIDSLELSESIRLNQIGFFPNGQKFAILLSEEPVSSFFVWDSEGKNVVFEGAAERMEAKTFSGKTTWKLDFSELSETGSYEIGVPGIGRSYSFDINRAVYQDLASAALKAFYFQRASTEISREFGGTWARSGGHPDTLVRVHPSAATPSRPEGTVVSAPRGWYDAGDYNKYIVNSGITVGTLLSLYESYPVFFTKQNLNIPESSNAVPDILDEISWNLDWMLIMQDPTDGGVYHKLTTAKFEGLDLEPIEATNQRYLVQKSTAATLDFAAVMAQASRVFKGFSPENAIVYQKAAEKAWTWALANPEVFYRQDELNAAFDPDISTGAYGDQNLGDEWVWAAAELYISSHNLDYWEILENADLTYRIPSWSQVKWLGFYSLIRYESSLEQIPSEYMATLKINLGTAAKALEAAGQSQAYLSPMGSDASDFIWGSNAVAANQGILLLEAYRLSGEVGLLQGARANMDYLLGRNATGYSYVTGFGSKTPQHPHHRLAVSRSELPPLPGFLVGGPNPSQQDGCDYYSEVPDESYVDDACSYASNEIAINWNAAFASLVNAIQALEAGLD